MSISIKFMWEKVSENHWTLRSPTRFSAATVSYDQRSKNWAWKLQGGSSSPAVKTLNEAKKQCLAALGADARVKRISKNDSIKSQPRWVEMNEDRWYLMSPSGRKVTATIWHDSRLNIWCWTLIRKRGKAKDGATSSYESAKRKCLEALEGPTSKRGRE